MYWRCDENPCGVDAKKRVGMRRGVAQMLGVVMVMLGFPGCGEVLTDGRDARLEGTNRHDVAPARVVRSEIGNGLKDMKWEKRKAWYWYEEIEAKLKETARRFPQLTQLQEIGKSVEGRPIWVMKISDRVKKDEPGEAEVFISSGVHAREQQPVHFAMNLIRDLTEGYEHDKGVKELVDGMQIWVMACGNPDGRIWDLAEGFEKFRFWRKNRRMNGDGTMGVDLNRNTSWRWGGSEKVGSSEVYEGRGPFSEPESRAIRKFVDSRRLRSWLELHSAGAELFTPRYLTKGDWEAFSELRRVFHKAQEERYQELTDGREIQPAGSEGGIERAGNTGTLWQWGYYTRGIYSGIMEIRRDVRLSVALQHYPGAGFIEEEYERNGRGAILAWIAQSRYLQRVRRPSRAVGPWVTGVRVEVDDDVEGMSKGNGDGKVNAGETLELRVWLGNEGDRGAKGVWGTLVSESRKVSVKLEYRSGYGDIAPGSIAPGRFSPDANSGSGESQGNKNSYVVKVSEGAKDGDVIPMKLYVFDGERHRWEIGFELRVAGKVRVSQ